MIIEQLSVFSENRSGMLADITNKLTEADIEIDALTIADTAEFGVVRLIVDAPKKALSVLKLDGYVASLTPVIALLMKHESKSLSKIAKILGDAKISIEYLYACVARKAGTAFVVLRVEELDEAVALLKTEDYIAYRT